MFTISDTYYCINCDIQGHFKTLTTTRLHGGVVVSTIASQQEQEG